MQEGGDARTESIWIAIIGCFGTCIGAILVFIVQMKQLREESKKRAEESQEKQAEHVDKIEESVRATLDEHRKEYMKEIAIVKEAVNDQMMQITNLQASYQNATAIIELKIDNLEKKQDKHNSVIERTFLLEQSEAVQDEQIKSMQEMIRSEGSRIAELERRSNDDGK